jgi:hypothetical protein
VAEWSKAAVLKTAELARVPGVRIPSPPPITRGGHRWSDACARDAIPELVTERAALRREPVELGSGAADVALLGRQGALLGKLTPEGEALFPDKAVGVHYLGA